MVVVWIWLPQYYFHSKLLRHLKKQHSLEIGYRVWENKIAKPEAIQSNIRQFLKIHLAGPVLGLALRSGNRSIENAEFKLDFQSNASTLFVGETSTRFVYQHKD